MISLSKLPLLAAALVLASSAQAAIEDTVATVNGQPIMLTEFQKEFSTAMGYWSQAQPEALRDPANLKKLKETTLEQLIDREVLYQEGVKQKIKVRERDIDAGVTEIKSRFTRDEEGRELSEERAQEIFEKQLKSDGLGYDQFRERLSKQIMAKKLIDQEVRAKMRLPEEKDVKAYFEKINAYVASGSTENPKGMDEEAGLAFRQIADQVRRMTAERVQVSRILVKISPNATENEKKRALKSAETIRAEILARGTSNFADIAKTESEDPQSAKNGGDIGYILRGDAPPDFEKVAFSLPVGEISQPIITEIGYNIIEVREKRAQEAPDFDRMKEDLAKLLFQIDLQKQVDSYVKDLKAKAVVQRNLTSIE